MFVLPFAWVAAAERTQALSARQRMGTQFEPHSGLQQGGSRDPEPAFWSRRNGPGGAVTKEP